MKIVAFTSHPEEATAGNYALITITPELAREILSRRELFQLVAAKDKALIDMSFWDGHAIFFDSDAGESLEELLLMEEYARLDDERWLEVPENFELPETHETRTVADHLVLQNKDFYWQAADKHSADRFDTEAFSYDMLVAIAAQAAAAP